MGMGGGAMRQDGVLTPQQSIEKLLLAYQPRDPYYRFSVCITLHKHTHKSTHAQAHHSAAVSIEKLLLAYQPRDSYYRFSVSNTRVQAHAQQRKGAHPHAHAAIVRNNKQC